MAKKLYKFEIYVNGFKEAEVDATDKDDAPRIYWQDHASKECLDLKQKGEARVIVEPIK